MMHATLNLAANRFTNHRLFWLAIVVVLAISAWLFVWISSEKAVVERRQTEVALRIKDLERQVNEALEREKKRQEEQRQAVLAPRDAEQLMAARRLVSQREFAWTRMLSDLERFIPRKARVSSISVEEVYEGTGGSAAQVSIRAVGQEAAQLTEMMESLNKSGGLFLVAQASQDQAADNGEVPFSLMVTYRPSGGAER